MDRRPCPIIITIDDLSPDPEGLSRALSLFGQGRASRASVLVNRPWSEAEARRLQAAGLPLGVHFNLTSGFALSAAASVPSLVDAAGRFRAANRTKALQHIVPAEWEREAAAQIQRFASLGWRLSHADHHRPEIYFHPPLILPCLDLAQRHGIPLRHPLSQVAEPQMQRLAQALAESEERLRELKVLYDEAFARRGVKTADVFYTDAYPGGLSALFSDLVRDPPPGVVEVAVHLEGDAGRSSAAYLQSAAFGALLEHAFALVRLD